MAITPTTSDLQTERGRLAFDLAEGVEGAAEALADVEARIIEATRDADRAAAAESERSRRLAAEAQDRAEAATAAAQAEMPALARRLAGHGDTIGRATTELCEAIAAFRDVDNDLRVTGRAAGVEWSSFRVSNLRLRLLGEIDRMFPGIAQHHFTNPSGETFGQDLRRSIADLLYDEPSPAEEA